MDIVVQAVAATSGAKEGVLKPHYHVTDKTRLCLDSGKARESLGWRPKVSLDEGIGKTMRWYEANIKKSE